MSSKLAVQMFTLREKTKTRDDFEESLRKISEIGYEAIQLSAVGAMNGETPEVGPEDAKKLLDKYGIKCVGTHRPWDQLMNNTEGEIAFHKTLDCDFCAIGSVPGDYGHTAEGYRQWIKDAEPVIQKLKDAGIRFGHHNHSKEFARIERHGKWLEDILIDEASRDLMIELDIYWAEHGGINAERVIERCPNRMPLVHLKDKEVDLEVLKEKGPVMAPIGEGNMDWDHLMPACEKAGVEYYAVEQDVCRRDPFDCLKSSFEYLKKFVD